MCGNQYCNYCGNHLGSLKSQDKLRKLKKKLDKWTKLYKIVDKMEI